jgi:hypothetical protein
MLVSAVLALAACQETAGQSPVSNNPTLANSKKTARLLADVAVFLKRCEGCGHFRGEEAYDEERGKFLIQAKKETCTGTDAELARLRRVYAGNAAVIAALTNLEDSIEYTGEETP